MKQRITLLAFFSTILLSACYKEPAPEPPLVYSIAYSAYCDDCDVRYTIASGEEKKVHVTGFFNSEATDTIIMKSGMAANIYAESRTSESPQKIIIYSPGDTSVFYEKTPRGKELLIGLSWTVYYPGWEDWY